jgi:beta-glucosidase
MKKKGFIFGNAAGILAVSAVLAVVNFLALVEFKQVITNYLDGNGIVFDSESANENGKAVCDEIMDESITLLKNNNNALPLASSVTKVNLLGYASEHIFYGGAGSGSTSSSGAETYVSALSDVGITANPDLVDLYSPDLDSAYTDLGSMDAGFNPNIPELTLTDDEYASAKEYSDTAIVVIGRSAGEGYDLTAGLEGEKHVSGSTTYGINGDGEVADYLELSDKESALLDKAESTFDNVIVVINAANALDLSRLDDSAIDAAIWVGHPGANGLSEFAKVLDGEVNPSGRLVDTYAYDPHSAPSFANSTYSHINEYTDYADYEVKGDTTGIWYTNYAEGIYVGYKYYETRYLDDEAGYKAAVQYPFGYGESYTTFTWTMGTVDTSTSGKISVPVTVTNTGDVEGKDVVELYFTAPYTAGGIEKSAVVLAAEEKTPSIAAGESKTVTLDMDIQDMASYDYSDANSDGHTGYELEAGDYVLSLRTDSHDLKASDGFTYTYSAPSTTYYDSSVGGATVVNQFADADVTENEGSDFKYLSRNDWDGTFPTYSAAHAAPQVVKDDYALDVADPVVSSSDTMPTTGTVTSTKGELTVDDITSYDDSDWEDLLNQISTSELSDLIIFGGYRTYSCDSIGKAATIDMDGPAGFNFSNISNQIVDAVSYPAEINVASTWNKEIAYDEGDAFGQEASAAGITGMYAPAMDTHRSPYDGRNFEYYSEDATLSGIMGAQVVKAAKANGLNCYIKHFAFNDQETHRDHGGLCTFINEQAIREQYLKPFQNAVEEGGARAVMSSMNRIGATWTGSSKALLTNVLRNEWGFEGVVVTDFYMSTAYPYQNTDRGIRAGNDMYLSGVPAEAFITRPDLTAATSVIAARKAAKNIIWSTIGAIESKGTVVATWLYWFIPLDVALWCGVAGWAGLVIFKGIKANLPKKKEDNSKSSK